MSEEPQPPSKHRLKSTPGATSRPAEAPPPQPAEKIDVQDFVRPIASQVFAYKSPQPPREVGLDHREKRMLRGLCVVGLAGITLLIWHVTSFHTAWAARAWPTTHGLVESAQLIEHTPDDGEDSTDTTYEAAIAYNYRVAGKSYRSTRVDLNLPVKYERLAAQQIVGRYRPGSDPIVHYDPKDPQTALLDISVTWTNWAEFSLGIVLTGSGLFAAYSLWRDWRRPG